MVWLLWVLLLVKARLMWLLMVMACLVMLMVW